MYWCFHCGDSYCGGECLYSSKPTVTEFALGYDEGYRAGKKVVSSYERASRKVLSQWRNGLISDREFALKMTEIAILNPEAK